MHKQNTLGLYVSKGQATGVCVPAKGHTREAVGGFRVTVSAAEPEPFKALAAQIAQACADKKLRFSDTVVALDCALFMQHPVHSEFINPKQIAATIRYDTEEVVATDVSAMAVSFQILSSGEGGSDLHVFTAGRAVLQDLILALQGHGMDPVGVEPDVCSLARFARARLTQVRADPSPTLAAVLSEHHGYFLRSAAPQQVVPIRAFMVGRQQNRTDLLAREAFATLAAADEPSIQRVVFYDSAGQVQALPLSGRLGKEVVEVDWFKPDPTEPATGVRTETDDPVPYAIAFGAALAHDDRTHTANFRNGDLAYAGKRIRLHSAMRWASISVTLLILAVGLHLQMRWVRVNQDTARLQERISKDYAPVMRGPIPKGRNPVEELRRELRRIKDIRSGELSLQESVLARLTLLLRAFTGLEKTELKIDSVDITTKTIRVDGSTKNLSATQTLYKTLQGQFDIIKEQAGDVKAGRSTFGIYLSPKKASVPGGAAQP
ncbi:MAG: hypothetical protein KBE04_00390 [Phycisphaerae bacterium]|nr:hypothetical protein [Phycisphaerae bacterium]